MTKKIFTMPSKPFITACVCVLSLGQSACTHWPEPGRGGMAEHHLESMIHVESHADLKYPHGLCVDFEIQKNHLDILILNGAQQCFPASVKEAEVQQIRIARQLHAGMYEDAANDLIIQNEALKRLERRLDYVRTKNTCALPKDYDLSYPTHLAENNTEVSEYSILDSLMDLLNSDNQFAVDSYQINPKYKQRLIRAAKLLEQHTQYNLHIFGHTDTTGEPGYNDTLSQQRAQEVAALLNDHGVTKERLSVFPFGEKSKQFHGKGKHVDLVNRRVNIQVIRRKNDVLKGI